MWWECCGRKLWRRLKAVLIIALLVSVSSAPVMAVVISHWVSGDLSATWSRSSCFRKQIHTALEQCSTTSLLTMRSCSTRGTSVPSWWTQSSRSSSRRWRGLARVTFQIIEIRGFQWGIKIFAYLYFVYKTIQGTEDWISKNKTEEFKMLLLHFCFVKKDLSPQNSPKWMHSPNYQPHILCWLM